MQARRAWLSRLIGACAIVALLGGSSAASAQPAAITVEDWSKQPAGKTGVPDGWTGQNWGNAKYDFRVQADGADKVLHLKSDNDGCTITKELKVDIKQYPILEWRWKAVVLPKGADSRRKETDDQAAQIYVTFPRFPAAVRSRIIGYVWDTTVPAGRTVKSEKTGTVTYVILRSGPGELGRWITETRNVYDDYKRIYGEEPGEQVGAVSVAIDSNDVKGTAESFMGEIRFRKP